MVDDCYAPVPLCSTHCLQIPLQQLIRDAVLLPLDCDVSPVIEDGSGFVTIDDPCRWPINSLTIGGSSSAFSTRRKSGSCTPYLRPLPTACDSSLSHALWSMAEWRSSSSEPMPITIGSDCTFRLLAFES